MSYTPSNYIFFIFYISILTGTLHLKCIGKLLGYRRFLGYKKFLQLHTPNQGTFLYIISL